MKALMANFSVGKEVWDRVKSKIFIRDEASHGISLEWVDVPAPEIFSPRWVKIRTVMSAISDLDEGLFFHRDLSVFGGLLSFPFVPGNESLGIVTEIGQEVGGIEPGERVVVDPMLSCRPREVHPVCPSCARGEPTCCRSFGKGAIGPGIMIGACQDTGGGWGDYFVAHRSQVRALPQDMGSETGILIPEFARAVKAVLAYAPAAGDRVVVMGAGSLGILTLYALSTFARGIRVLVVAEHGFEAEVARGVADAEITIMEGRGSAYEEVASFVSGTVRYPRTGRITMEGGADIVFETTGRREMIDDALRFTGEGKRLALMSLNQVSGVDLSPLWFKGVRMGAVGFSGRQSHKGETKDVMDVALDLAKSGGLPVNELLSHRFRREDHRPAFSALENRAGSSTMKVVFQNVV